MGILSFDLSVPHTPDEVARRLAPITRPPLTWGQTFKARFVGPGPGPMLAGHVTGDAFSLTPVTRRRPLFLPIAHGRIMPSPRGAQIHVDLRLKLIDIIIGALFAVLVFAGWFSHGKDAPLTPIIIFTVLCIAVFGLTFWVPAKRLQTLLEQTLR